ncbi:MAG TPA: NAD(P)/FAD-dependent oxidoreductase [Mesorhizobium sp.]|jgi:2-polyprenyl-6-methoxyphenol hydroxylase-like FAD-dependent oxidoreductase|nr:NAD(P)/FAD-dependent oxidoreductase [Mesorhizobium sp.]
MSTYVGKKESLTMLPESTDILIVGGGPTGLALACALQQAGVDHLIVERLTENQNTSRAAVVHAHTLEMLEKISVADELVRRGLTLSRFAIRDRDRALLELGFDSLPSRYAFMLMIPQDETERVLNDRLAALGGKLHRGVTARTIVKQAKGADVYVRTAAGEQVVKARFVVGADGMHSLVRSAADIEFDGSSYEESFVLADVKMDWALGRTEVSLFFAPAGLVVVAPLPNGNFRVVATLDGAPERPGLTDVQRIIDSRGPTTGAKLVHEVVWSSRFRLHHRVARAYRSGPLLLMGDAAHVHSPAGGQGMNTGLVDALVLGEVLTGVVRSEASEVGLAEYEALRRQAATEVLGLAGILTRLATVRSKPQRIVRNAVLRAGASIPVARRRLRMGLSGLARKDLANLEKVNGRGARRTGGVLPDGVAS